MNDEHGPSGLTAAELESKIQQLEQEVSLLRERLRQKNTPRPAVPAKHSDGLISNSWLVSFGQFLLLEPDRNSIANALARLGQLFDVRSCSLWRVDSSIPTLPSLTSIGYECLGQWPQEESRIVDESRWLQAIWKSNTQLSADLSAGTPLALLAADPSLKAVNQPLLSVDIFSSLLVPVMRYNMLEGFVVLHRSNKLGWVTRDLGRLKFIANALFIMHDRQQLVRQLSTRDTRFNYAIEASSDGLWDWDITTGRIYFSRSYLRMLGFQYEELPGNLTALQDYFLYRDDAPMVMQRYQTAIEKCETHVNLQFRMQHQSGKILWVQSKTKFCEPDSSGRPTRCVGLNTDISDFIYAHEELLAAKTQADAANKTKSEFLARMSHEIRTPMNAIIGLGYLLKDTRLDQQQKSYLSSLNAASDSLLYIINEVLDFSKIEAGKVILEQANFDLNHLFEKILRLFEISATDKKVRIIYDLTSNVPRFLRGDAVRLSQIIGHLINNALQYSKTTEVVVSVKLLEAKNKLIQLQFKVTDFGVGMSPERLAKVNDSLNKHMRISDAGGNRFGLCICNHLISLMNGTMTIESELNKGCCVTFTACFDNSHLGARVLHTHNRDLKNIRALVVDDNLIARTVLTSTANSLGLQADSAENASQALQKIVVADSEAKPYHFVLMDYQMPGMNGFEAATAIKSNSQLSYFPHVIVVSGYHRDEISKAENSSLDVDEFMSKPVSESRLFDTISNIISKDPKLQSICEIKEQSSGADSLLNHLTILIVEDNLVNQQVVKGILKKKKINIAIANNGIEALSAISRQDIAFDAVLMDLEMPEMDGITATKAIRSGSVCPDIPIIALTAQAMRGDRESCLAAGMNAYLSKPINPEILYRTLAEQLSLHMEKKSQ
ncbi:MAG TPA: response regulator [Cellvibrio sp.]|nr:response regulator [Cellvibrio sp.]